VSDSAELERLDVNSGDAEELRLELPILELEAEAPPCVGDPREHVPIDIEADVSLPGAEDTAPYAEFQIGGAGSRKRGEKSTVLRRATLHVSLKNSFSARELGRPSHVV
jgi:hypothetical protein